MWSSSVKIGIKCEKYVNLSFISTLHMLEFRYNLQFNLFLCMRISAIFSFFPPVRSQTSSFYWKMQCAWKICGIAVALLKSHWAWVFLDICARKWSNCIYDDIFVHHRIHINVKLLWTVMSSQAQIKRDGKIFSRFLFCNRNGERKKFRFDVNTWNVLSLANKMPKNIAFNPCK